MDAVVKRFALAFSHWSKLHDQLPDCNYNKIRKAKKLFLYKQNSMVKQFMQATVLRMKS